jgi:hypothetical protein
MHDQLSFIVTAPKVQPNVMQPGADRLNAGPAQTNKHLNLDSNRRREKRQREATQRWEVQLDRQLKAGRWSWPAQ